MRGAVIMSKGIDAVSPRIAPIILRKALLNSGSAIVLRETTGPVRYRFGKTVTYVTRSGRALDEQTVRTKIKVGVPVQVHFTGTGANRMVDRVILEED